MVLTTKQKPVWLDCDPGHDDALAIILAGYHPSVQLLGVSTVAGNQAVEKVTDNALRVLAAAGLERVPVVMGQSKPLMRPAVHCPQIHGESGLDGPLGGPILPPSPHSPIPGKAVVVMFETIRDWSSINNGTTKVQLVATGALSNVALLLMIYPEVAEMVDVVLMGGCLGTGNTGPVVEFNIQTDPEAAAVVFSSGVSVTMVPLEVTHAALVTKEVQQRIGAPGPHPFLDLIIELLVFFAEMYRKTFMFENPPLHDPCAVAYVIAPELFTVEHLRVDVETCSPLSAGQTVVDIWKQSGRPPNAYVCMSMDVKKFWELMVTAVHDAATQSPLQASPRVLGASEETLDRLKDGICN